MLEDLKEKLVYVAREMKASNLVATAGTGYISGNISIRDRGSGNIVITPSGVDYSIMRPEDAVVVTLEGKKLEGQCKPSGEKPMHLYIYLQRDDIFGIVHTHSSYAVTISAIGCSIPVVLHDLAVVQGGGVPLAEYAPGGTVDIGKNALKAMKNLQSVLLPLHGTLTIAGSVEEALNLAVIVEEAAKVYYRTLLLNKVRVMPEDEVNRLHKQYLNYGQRSH